MATTRTSPRKTVWIVLSFPAHDPAGDINYWVYPVEKQRRARKKMLRTMDIFFSDHTPVVRLVKVSVPDLMDDELLDYIDDRLDMLADKVKAVAQWIPLGTHPQVIPRGGTYDVPDIDVEENENPF